MRTHLQCLHVCSLASLKTPGHFEACCHALPACVVCIILCWHLGARQSLLPPSEAADATVTYTNRPCACAGGELQRFAIAVVAAQGADIYMIDEPSSFLDVRQRLKAAQVGRRCASLPLKRRCQAHSAYPDCCCSGAAEHYSIYALLIVALSV